MSLELEIPSADRAHYKVVLLTPASSSARVAVSSVPTWSWSEFRETEPGSSTSVTLVTTSSEAALLVGSAAGDGRLVVVANVRVLGVLEIGRCGEGQHAVGEGEFAAVRAGKRLGDAGLAFWVAGGVGGDASREILCVVDAGGPAEHRRFVHVGYAYYHHVDD